MVTCPFCKVDGNTKVETGGGCSSTGTVLFFCFLCFLSAGVFAFIACCWDALKDHKHTCSSCNAHISTQSFFNSYRGDGVDQAARNPKAVDPVNRV